MKCFSLPNSSKDLWEFRSTYFIRRFPRIHSTIAAQRAVPLPLDICLHIHPSLPVRSAIWFPNMITNDLTGFVI